MSAIHYTNPYLINPQHRVTVDLIGLGGTGSQVLTLMGRLDRALVQLGHPGLHVRGWDPDTVSESNVGRQLFAPTDVGQNKAVCLMSRLNRFFSTEWEAWPHPFGSAPLERSRSTSNITITCVDTIKARKEIGAQLKGWGNMGVTGDALTRTPYYWLDYGNAQKTGQVILGTIRKPEQKKGVRGLIGQEQATADKLPAGAVKTLPTVLEEFPELIRQKDEDSGPSCSLAEALTKQDLTVNSLLANLGWALLWKLFREGRLTQRGAYLNLETLCVTPINI